LRKLMASVQPERHSKNIYKYEEESRFHFKWLWWWYTITALIKIVGTENSIKLKTHLSNSTFKVSSTFSSFHLNNPPKRSFCQRQYTTSKIMVTTYSLLMPLKTQLATWTATLVGYLKIDLNVNLSLPSWFSK
jgi:hypothetical protein